MIQSLGRLDWQEACGYGKRALVETTMGRYKAIIGPRLRARDWRGQRSEAAVAVAVLNRMLGAGRPNCVRTSALAAKAALGLGQARVQRDPCNAPVVLFDDVVEVFVLAQQDIDAGIGLDAIDGRRVGADFVDGDLLWQVM